MHRLLLLSALFLMSACSSTGGSKVDIQALADLDIPYTKTVLDNGLTVIVHEDHKTPIVAVNVWYHVGSKNEKKGRTGFAHLFEHLMFSGSENYNDEYFKPFENVGATEMNGTTNSDRTNYFQNVPSNALDLALWMESDRMGHLLNAIDQESLDEQRGVVKNEKRQREDQSYGKVWSLVTENSWPEGHPYSWSVIGSMDDLDAASLDDVKQWFNDYYGASNAVITIAGDVTAAEALARVKHYFADIPAGKPVLKPKRWEAPLLGSRRIAIEDKVPQARLYMAWNVPAMMDPQAAQLGVVQAILGNGKSSRLHKRLVLDEKIASDVAVYMDKRELASQFLILATALPGKTLADLEALIHEELELFLQEGPTEAELKLVKVSTAANFARGLERVGGFGGKSDLLAASEVFGGSPDAWQQGLQDVLQTTTGAVQKVAQQWLSKNTLVVEVQPEADNETEAAVESADRSQLPAVGKHPELVLPVIEKTTLSNGIKLWLAERAGAPVVQMQMAFDAGFAADAWHAPGIAHATMSLLDEGAAGQNALALSDALKGLGAGVSTGASLDQSTVSLSALKATLPDALALYADIIKEPDFPQKEFERVQPLLLAGLEQEKARPVGLALRTLPPLLYGENHPYSNPLTGKGTTAAIQAMTRDDLLAYRAAWLRPEKAHIIVVGDITMAAIKPMLEEHFGAWSMPGKAGVKEIPTVTQAKQPSIWLVDKPGAEQSLVIAGQLAPPRNNPDEVALTMLNEVLGGKFTSRLNLNLREDKHWSYGASSFFFDAKAQRPFIAYARVQADKTMESMQEIQQEIAAILSDKPVTQNELDASVKSLTLTLPGSLETASAVLGTLADMAEFNLSDDHYANYVNNVQAVNAEMTTAAGQKAFNADSLVWVVVGDLEAIRAKITQSGLGPVQELTVE